MLRLLKGVTAVLIMGLSCFLSAGVNLLQNSNFEAGKDYHYSVGRWYINGIEDAVLDPKQKVHGNKSLRLKYSRRAYVLGKEKYSGISIRSTIGVNIRKGKHYTFSIYAKSSASKRMKITLSENAIAYYKSKPITSKRGLLRKRWQRYKVSFRAKRDSVVYWQLEAFSKQAGNLWLDAAQLNKGKLISYRPQKSVEAGLEITTLGKIFSLNQNKKIRVHAYNSSKKSVVKKFIVHVRNLKNDTILAKNISVSIKPNETKITIVNIEVKKYGVFKAVLIDGNSEIAEQSFSINRKARNINESDGSFGIYATFSEKPLKILQGLGFKWLGNLTTNGRLTYWNMVETKKGKFNWYDDDIVLAKKYGFQLLLNLEPQRFPRWAKRLSKQKKMKYWLIYVNKIVKHYKHHVRHWVIADEPHAGKKKKSGKHLAFSNAREYALWHIEGYKAIKKVDKNALVLMNTLAGFADETLKHMSEKYVDIMGVNSYHHYPYLIAMKRVTKKHGIKRLWAPGIAVRTHSIYKNRLPTKIRNATPKYYWELKNRILSISIIRTLGEGFEKLFHYTGAFVANTNRYSVFESDSGLKPYGSQFGALIWLLDGVKQAAKISFATPKSKLSGFQFKKRNGKAMVAVWGLLSYKQRIDFSMPQDLNVVVYDNYTNVIKQNYDIGSATLSINLGIQPVYFEMKSVDLKRFVKLIRLAKLTILDPPMDR